MCDSGPLRAKVWRTMADGYALLSCYHSPKLIVFESLHSLSSFCFPQAKHLQFVSGVHSTSYWMATFAWDLINALVPVIISFILFAVFQIDAYTGDGLAAILLLLVLVGGSWGGLVLACLISSL